MGNIYFMFFILFLLLMTRQFHAFQTCIIVGASSMLINANLKLFFQVPLMAHLGNGFAFPSGHLQMSTVFYGCLCALHLLHKKVYGFVLIAIAWAIFYQNFHTPLELLGGFISGMLVISLFFYTPILKHPFIIFIISTLLMAHIRFEQYFFSHFIIPYSVLILMLCIHLKFSLKTFKKN
jgi:undecaprenyl-diphosphatase